MARYLGMLSNSLIWFSAAALLGGCGSSTEPRRPATVNVTGPTTIGSLGSTIKLTATVLDGSGSPMSGVVVQWSSSNSAVASIDGATGTVKAIGPGSVTLRATADGTVGSHDVSVAQIPFSLTITSPTDTLRALTATVSCTAAVKDSGGALIVAQGVVWSSSNPAIVSVTDQGVATAVTNGPVFVRAQAGSVLDSIALAVHQRASAASSTLRQTSSQLMVGDTVRISVEARDSLNQRLAFGGSSVTVSAAAFGGASSGLFSPVVDNGDGTYSETIVATAMGSPTHLTVAIDGRSVTASPVISVLGFIKISVYSAGFPVTCGILTTQELYCWGSQAGGMRGDGSSSPTVSDPTPTLVSGGLRWTDVTTALTAACGIANAKVYCWGSASGGQLGNGTTNGNYSTPLLVAPESSFVSIKMGLSFGVCALTVAHSGMCWGGGTWGRLGNGADTTASRPVGVNGGNRFGDLATSYAGSCGITQAGAALCWGYYSVLGMGYGPYPDDCGGVQCSKSPVAVTGGITFRPVIIHDGNTACAIATNDKTYCWGQIAQEVPGAPVFTALAAGDLDYCGLAPTGTVYCWGTNRNGRFGSPPDASVYQSTPLAVPGGQNFTQIAMSQNHMCAIASDGNAWCWGSNGNGELGDRTTTPSRTPVRVRLFTP
jgi:alpha-tubulin suppressor-like RCC1 family protein